MGVPLFDFERQESTGSNNTIVQSSPQRRPSHIKLSDDVLGESYVGLSDSQRNESIITLKDELLIPSTSTNQLLPPIDVSCTIVNEIIIIISVMYNYNYF